MISTVVGSTSIYKIIQKIRKTKINFQRFENTENFRAMRLRKMPSPPLHKGYLDLASIKNNYTYKIEVTSIAN